MASAKSESYIPTFRLFPSFDAPFFCLEALKQTILDLIAQRIFSLLLVEYTISRSRKTTVAQSVLTPISSNRTFAHGV